MSVNFGLLGLGPQSRSLTPENAPGDKLFAREIEANKIRQGNERIGLESERNQETKRSNLAGEELNRDKFGLDVAKANESIRQFGVTETRLNREQDREDAKFGLDVEKFKEQKENTDWNQEFTEKSFAEDIRRFEKNFGIKEADLSIRERAQKITEEVHGANMEDRRYAEAYREGLGQAYEEGGIEAAQEFRKRNGDFSGALETELTLEQMNASMRKSGLADRQYNDSVEQKKLLAMEGVAAKVVAATQNMSPGAANKAYFTAAQEMNKAMGGGREIKTVEEARSFITTVQLGLGTALAGEANAISQGQGTKAQAAMMQQVFGGDINKGVEEISDGIISEATGKGNPSGTLFDKAFGDALNAPAPADIKVVQSLRQEVDKSLTNFNAIKNALETALTRDSYDGKQAQISLIFALAKANDPSGKVTDADVALQQGAGNIGSKLGGLVKKYTSGEKFTDAQVKDALLNIKQGYEVRRKEAQQIVDRMKRSVKGRNIEFDQILDEKALDIPEELFVKGRISSKEQAIGRIQSFKSKLQAAQDKR